MRGMSAEGRATMNKRRNFVNYARMTLSDGTVLNLQPQDFRISGNTFTDDLVSGDNFQVGTVIGKTCTLRLDNTDERFSQYDFYMARFSLYLHLPEAYEDEHGVLQDEVFTIGLFTVTQPTTTGTAIDITGIDEVYKLDTSFDACTLDFSTRPTLYQILYRCCIDCDIAVGFSTFDNSTMTVTNRPEGVTYREVVSYVCQMAGVNAKINSTGSLILTWYNMAIIPENLDGGSFSYEGTTSYQDGDTADGGSFNPWSSGASYDGGTFDALPFHHLSQVKGLTISTDDIQFTGVRVSNENTTVQYPSSSVGVEYILEVKDNPFTVEKENTIATFLYNKISQLVFRPFSCSFLQDPTIEAGDAAVIWDIKGNPHNTIITNVTYNTNGMMSIACKAQNPTKQKSSYKNAAARAVVEARKNTEKQIDAYVTTVDHFNEIANNALGYYKTEQTEQGATITYYHDAPTLGASTNIIKVTASGIFISDDGGQSYTSGWETSTATMLMNLVYAHGITADWVTSGLFQDKQGKFILDIDNSTLKLDLNSTVGSGTDATTLGQMLTKINATEQGLSTEVMRAKSAEGELNSVYSGAYTPLTGNAPALNWTTEELKQKHLNDLFYDTLNGNSYQWKSITGAVLLEFDERSQTESISYDYVEIYYWDNSANVYRYTKRYGGKEGATGGNTISNLRIVVPSNTFYVYWRSDGSVYDWGFKINVCQADSMAIEDINTFYPNTTSSLPTSEIDSITGTSIKPETSHPYTNGEVKLWRWETQLSIGGQRYDWSLRQDIETMYSSITQTAEQISLKVSKGSVCSEITQESGQISLTSGRLLITSGNFQLNAQGIMTCYGANINGDLHCGTYAGYLDVEDGELTFYTNIDHGSYEEQHSLAIKRDGDNIIIMFDGDSYIDGTGAGSGGGININSSEVVFSINDIKVTSSRNSGTTWTGRSDWLFDGDGNGWHFVNGILVQ